MGLRVARARPAAPSPLRAGPQAAITFATRSPGRSFASHSFALSATFAGCFEMPSITAAIAALSLIASARS